MSRPKGARLSSARRNNMFQTVHQLTPRCAALGRDHPTAGGSPVPQTKARPKPGSLQASTTRRLLLVLLIRFVVALLTALARLLRLLTWLLIVAALILLAALVWIIH